MKFGKLKALSDCAVLCVLLLLAFLLYQDPFLLLWWPQDPAERPKTGGLALDTAAHSSDDVNDVTLKQPLDWPA